MRIRVVLSEDDVKLINDALHEAFVDQPCSVTEEAEDLMDRLRMVLTEAKR